MSEGSGQDFYFSMNTFTPRAQQVLFLARKEADQFNHNFVGTEHILLGLIRLGQGTAVTVLGQMGLNLDTVRAEVEKRVGKGPEQAIVGNIPYTPRVKKVLALAAKEARSLNHNYVGTEHILLGMLREGDGVAHDVLKDLGVDTERTREMILRELDPNYGGDETKNSGAALAMEPPKVQPDTVDTSKRYDVYCIEKNQELVYRNARFKARKALLPRHQNDFLAEFLELEQADGQTVFIARSSVIKFCEPGVAPKSQAVGDKGEDS